MWIDADSKLIPSWGDASHGSGSGRSRVVAGRNRPARGLMDRMRLLQRGVWLAVATVGWNVIEGVIAVAAGMPALSVALIGFGIDSFVETASGAVVGWRLRAELRGRADKERAEALERRAAGRCERMPTRRSPALGFQSRPSPDWS